MLNFDVGYWSPRKVPKRSRTVRARYIVVCWHSFVNFYRPQRSWGKVIFSEACIKNSVHGGGVPGQVPPPAGTPPRQAHPPGRYTPQGRYTPRAGTPPWAGTPPDRYTPQQCMLGYSQQAGGTHPTGMHSFSICSDAVFK